MAKTLLFDMNNLALRCFFGAPEVESESKNPNFTFWEYLVFNSIYSMMRKHKPKKVILGVDHGSWRKLVYPVYKQDRKKKRDQSEVDWDLFYQNFNRYLEEMGEVLPFNIIQAKSAEADDVIGVLSKKIPDSIIVSADSDYLQLSDYSKIYHPMRQKFVSTSNTEKFVQYLSLCGQKKDNIFNVKTPLNWPDGKRKPPLGEKMADKIIENGLDQFLDTKIKHSFTLEDQDYYFEVDPRERYETNRLILDFEKIPQTIQNRILEQYQESFKNQDIDLMYKFFKNKGWNEVLENYDWVESSLQTLLG